MILFNPFSFKFRRNQKINQICLKINEITETRRLKVVEIYPNAFQRDGDLYQNYLDIHVPYQFIKFCPNKMIRIRKIKEFIKKKIANKFLLIVRRFAFEIQCFKHL